MIITINDREKDLKFTFNSFRYLGDFDLSVLSEIDKKPFKIIQITKELLYGAVNYDPKDYISETSVDEYLEASMVDGDIVEMLTSLMELLDDSDFFKQLQKPKSKAKAKKVAK